MEGCKVGQQSRRSRYDRDRDLINHGGDQMEEDRKTLHKKICVNLGIAVVAILLILFLLPKLVRFFTPLLVAWIVAMLANPLIQFLEKKINIVRKHGSAIVIILVIAAICAATYGLVALIWTQASALVRELPAMYVTVMDNLQRVFTSLHEKYHIIPANVQSLLNNQESSINDYIVDALKGLQNNPFSTVGSVASSVVDGIVYGVLTILASYFMIIQKENMSRAIQEHTPQGVLSFGKRVKTICFQAIGGYFKAHFKIMLVIFLITVIPFFFMGVAYSGFVAALIAIVDFLPFLGAGTILGPWAVYLIATGSYRMGIILIVMYLVIMVVRQFLEPKLVGDSIGISPFEILIFMLIGYRLIGMLGLILSIPAGMIILACYREGMFDSYIRGIKILVKDINEYRKY